jgi:hypothetical protein
MEHLAPLAGDWTIEIRLPGSDPLSRDDPDFAQRYRGTLDDDGRAIRGAWEKAMDHVTWERDFALDYLRAG